MVKILMSVPNVMTIFYSFWVIKSEREVRSGQMRYRWIDLIEIHHQQLFKTPSLAFYDSKTSKNLKNGHGAFIAAIAELDFFERRASEASRQGSL